MNHRPLTGACRCAFFADKAKIARWYSPVRVIAEVLSDGHHYTLAQLRELGGTTCARKSISLLKEQGYKISSKRIPHSRGKKEYWLTKGDDDEG